MSWKKAPQGLVETFEAVKPGPPAVHKQMFGYPCCFVNGNMFMGLHEEHLILRLGDDERGRLLAVPGATPFEPMPGRVMHEYVVVPPSLLADRVQLSAWVGKALAHAATLPAKGKLATAGKPRKSAAPAPTPAPAARARKAKAPARKQAARARPSRAAKTPR